MYSVGVDVGYSSVKIVLIDEDRNVEYSKYIIEKTEWLKIRTGKNERDQRQVNLAKR